MVKPWTMLLLAWLAATAHAGDFDDDFTGRVMRLDFFHTGHASLEQFSVDRVRVEGPWPGSRTKLLDDTNLGHYFFELYDVESDRTIYSRGFSSIYGEWATTAEAQDGRLRTFPEALRFPEPKRPVLVILSKRNEQQAFHEVWDIEIDPASRFVARGFETPGTAVPLGATGPLETRVDLLFLGDGYMLQEKEKFLADGRRLSDGLFAVEPFRSRRNAFNVWSVFTPAVESGISNPRAGTFRDSPLGTSYNSLDSDRYVLTLDDRLWRDAAACAPYDFVVILVNARKYGGGGIHNLYCTASADSAFAEYLVVHEFGHHFAGLGDEYFTSAVAYEALAVPSIEPWEPNITALLDPGALKWKDLVPSGTPLPTPWPAERFRTTSLKLQERRAALRENQAPEEELEALFREEQEMVGEILPSPAIVGAFEGAMYQAKGLYRPSPDCIMFTRDPVGFCKVCARAVEAVIDQHTE